MNRIIYLSFVICHLSFVSAVAQPVEIGKTYRISPDLDREKSLFVKNASLENGSPVVVWTETNVPAQQWTVLDAGDGKVALKNVYTGKFLNASGNALTQTAKESAWTLTAVDETAGDYTMKQKGYLRVTSTLDGRQPIMGTAQTWHFTEVAPQPVFNETIRERMLQGYLDHYLQRKDRGYYTFCNGGWGEAETLETILDCYEATRDAATLEVFENCYKTLKFYVGTSWNGGTIQGGYNWFGYDFNDDVMWMVICAARAYHLTGKRTYINDAKRNFDLIWERAYLGYIGMLRWAENTGDRNGTNSCINGPAEVAACYIADALADESYYEKARLLYQNQRKYLFEPSTGKVWDSVVLDPTTLQATSTNYWVSTYNQGTMLGAAVLLYRHYGTQQYKDDADKIIAQARSSLCNSDGLVSVCQNADGDFQGFKGILMRYAGLYVREFKADDYRQWILKNAFHAYNNMNSDGYGHSAWLTKAGEDLMFGKVDYSTEGSAFGGSTCLTAAFAIAKDDLAATAVRTVEHRPAVDHENWYAISGTRVDYPSRPGIYVKGNRKYIVK